jgi:regulatory protein
MADGRVARLDGIDGGGTEHGSAPVARLGGLPGETAAPVADDPAAEPGAGVPVDLRSIGTAGRAPAAAVADLGPAAARERTVPQQVDGGPDGGDGPGPVALFDSASIGAARDVPVAELGPAALGRRAGRRMGSADRPRSRRAGPAPRGGGDDREPARGRRRAGSADPPERAAQAEEPPGAELGAPAAGERGGRRGRRGRQPEGLDPDVDPVALAREICLRLLTDRARTRGELAQALRRKGIPDEVAHTVLERFDEVGLIDDAAFAAQWTRSRHAHRGLARRAIAMELRRKGVSDEDAVEALAEVDAESEERRARELVDRKLRSLAVGTAEQRATAGRRLVGMLARKGYGAGTAYRVVKEALAERGAEVDELGEGEIPEE